MHPSSALRWVEAREDHLSVHTAIGRGLFAWGEADGPGASVSLQHPLRVALMPDGRVLVCDTNNHRPLIIEIEMGAVEVFDFFGRRQGTAAFPRPRGP